MIGASISALASYWRRNLLQLFTLIFGLALATALWSGVQAINAEARASYDAAAATLGEAQYDQLLPAQGRSIPQSRYVALRRAGWQVSPVLDGRMVLAHQSVRLIGLDPLTAPAGIAPVGSSSASVEVGLVAFLREPILVAAPETARALEGLGDFQIVQDADVAPGLVLTDIGLAQELLDLQGEISRLILLPMQPRAVPALGTVAPDLVRQSAGSGSEVGRLTGSFHLNLTAFGLLSFAVGIFIVHGTISLAFEQRRAILRSLRLLGVPLRMIVILVGFEMLVFSIVAGGIGVILGYMMAAVLLPDVAATLRGLYGADVGGTLQFRPVWWVSGFAIAVGGTAIASAGAIYSIARMPMLSPARSRAWVVASGKATKILICLSACLLFLALCLGIWGSGLVMGFVLLAALLLGAALALPALLQGAVQLAQARARSALWQWFWADTRQQVPGMSLALMALLLAAAANIGVSTMVSSFRLTFTEFLDQRLAPELFVQLDDPARGAELEAFVAGRAWEVLPLAFADMQLSGVPSELYGARIGQTYRENWVLLSQTDAPWDAVAAGQGLIASEQLARRSGKWTGDSLQLSAQITLPIVGVVADYGNPRGQAVVAHDVFTKIHPETAPTRFGLRSHAPEELRRALIDDFGLDEGALINQASIKAFSLSVFERTFTVTAALNILTLAVAAFAILMSLLTLSAMRLPQLAPVWALGMTRAQLGKFELLRAVVLSVITVVMALPLGLCLAWVLLAVVNVEAFGWRLPMYTFPKQYALMIAFALIAACLAALWPARRLAVTPPGELLKVFANDR